MSDIDVDKFYSDVFVTELLNSIDIEKVNESNLMTDYNHHKDTVYLTAVDSEGMGVSLIFSIFDSIGIYELE